MRLILIWTVLALAVLVAACGGNAAPPATNPTSIPVPTNAPVPTQAAAQPTIVAASTQVPPTGASAAPDQPTGAPLDVVKKASLEVFSADTVRASTAIEPANGASSTLTLEYVKPDRIHVVQTNSEGQTAERIAIKGTGFWTKDGDTWESEGADAAGILFALLTPDALEASFKVIQVDSIQFVGAELLNGKPVFVYTYKTVVDFGGQKANGDGKLWVGALDGRAYQGESISDSFTVPGSQDHTLVTYEYDIPLSIEAPQ